MENEKLIQEHLDAIALTHGHHREYKPIAKSSASITIEHMKGFAEWIETNYVRPKEADGKWHTYDDHTEYLASQNREVKERIHIQGSNLKTTEELIQLYFESLNKKE